MSPVWVRQRNAQVKEDSVFSGGDFSFSYKQFSECSLFVPDSEVRHARKVTVHSLGFFDSLAAQRRSPGLFLTDRAQWFHTRQSGWPPGFPSLRTSKCLLCTVSELPRAVKDFGTRRINQTTGWCFCCHGNWYWLITSSTIGSQWGTSIQCNNKNITPWELHLGTVWKKKSKADRGKSSPAWHV